MGSKGRAPPQTETMTNSPSTAPRHSDVGMVPAARLPNGAVPISASLRASCTSETMGSDSGDGRIASIEAKGGGLAASVAAIAKAVEETRQGMSERCGRRWRAKVAKRSERAGVE